MKSKVVMWTLTGVAVVTLLQGVAFAGTLVPDLNDADAVEYTIPDTNDDIDSGVIADGLTLAVRATLNATDVANSATGVVNLLEIGGTTSGTGLIVVDGYYWVSSSQGARYAWPSSDQDLYGFDGAFGVAIGPVTPGVQNDVFFSLDNTNHRLVVGLDGDYSEYTFEGVGGGWNWKGNGTITFAGNHDEVTDGEFGWRGGQTDATNAGVFYNMNAFDPTGTVSLGQYFNDVTSIPEPASLALLGLGTLAILRRR
jgi:hypothetical protein